MERRLPWQARGQHRLHLLNLEQSIRTLMAGIGWIAAISPPVKGRIDRLWGLQDRFVVELRLAGVVPWD
jgi:hypothetical protein